MGYKLFDLTLTQLARLVFLVKRCEAVELAQGGNCWAILIHGRGFTRLLEEDGVPLRGGLTAHINFEAKPKTFPNRATAENWMRHMGLLPRQTRWALAER